VTGWLLLALSQAAIAAGGWLLSRHIGWEATVAVLLIVEGGIGALYGTLTAGKGLFLGTAVPLIAKTALAEAWDLPVETQWGATETSPASAPAPS
jgi:hypothetical protein